MKLKAPQPRYGKDNNIIQIQAGSSKFIIPKPAAAYDTVGCTELRNETNPMTAIQPVRQPITVWLGLSGRQQCFPLTPNQPAVFSAHGL